MNPRNLIYALAKAHVSLMEVTVACAELITEDSPMTSKTKRENVDKVKKLVTDFLTTLTPAELTKYAATSFAAGLIANAVDQMADQGAADDVLDPDYRGGGGSDAIH